MLKKISKLLIVAILALNISLMAGASLTASAGFCSDLEGEFAGFLDCDDQFTSFTDFEGGLNTPDSEGFDSSLTQAKDARTFIKNIANFALGFLGIIAMMVIIYSGYMYVIAAGDEDKMNKGKSGITSAVIGIVIILSSFAIVNTVLQIPSGDSTNITNGVAGTGATSQSTNTAQIATYNIASEEIADLTRDFVATYEKYNNNLNRINQLTAYTPSEFTSRRDFVDYLQKLKDELNRLANQSGSLSYTSLAANQTIFAIINPSLEAIGEQIKKENRQHIIETQMESGLENFIEDVGSSIADAWTGTVSSIFNNNENFTQQDIFNMFECSLPVEERGVNYTADSCDDMRNTIGTNDYGTNIDQAFDTAITDIVFLKGVHKDYEEKLNAYILRLENLKSTFEAVSSSTDNSITTKVQTVIASLQNEATEPSGDDIFSAFQYDTSFLDNGSLGDNNGSLAMLDQAKEIIVSLQDLYNVLKTVQFTNPIIDVNTFRGAAPLVVTFDASRSYNPANITIENKMYKWDMDGDGKFDDSAAILKSDGILCDKGNNQSALESEVNSTITCTFENPGTYTIGLQLDAYSKTPTDNQKIFPGIAYMNIQVTTPVSKIDLHTNVKGADIVLRSYDAAGRIATEQNTLNVALKEIENGITFDATETEGNKPLSFDWSFDGYTGEQSGTNHSSAEVKYTERGAYQALLTVTDAQSNVDRKQFTINVQDIVARIRASAVTGVPGTEIDFTAADSASDAGGISTYIWEVKKDGAKVSTDANNQNEDYKFTFDQPGEYVVSLLVKDSQNEDRAELSVNIESQPPQAVFSASFPKENQPSYLVLNADQSYDPDPNDELIYKWTIFNAREGSDFEIIEGQLNDSNESLLSLNFLKKENYKIELKVFDTQLKSSAASQTVSVDSLVDIRFAKDQTFAGQLNDESKATLNFALESKFGDILKIDFGDGKNDTLRFEGGIATVNHDYKKAGAFEVVATAEDGDDINSTKETIIIGGGDNPIAVPSIEVRSTIFTDLENLPVVYRSEDVKFDATKSINTDGTNSNLSYQWDFGDGEDSTGSKASHVYSDLPPSDSGEFKVTLIVTNEDSQQDEKTFSLKLEEAFPEAKSLLATSLGGTVTPIQVKLEVISPIDRDGRVVKYKYYYYPVNDTGRQLGVSESDSPQATIKVDTFGLEGDENEYAFCVDLTDDDGNVVECKDLFDSEKLATLVVVNGKNAVPISDFTVSDTLINVGETVNFLSKSSDPDGEIIEYTYDFNGDGSFVDDPKSDIGEVSHVYHKRSSDEGYAVKLKVLDDKGATAQSEITRIVVNGILDEPTAAFLSKVKEDGLVKFTDKSKADEVKGGSITDYKWDFDLNIDSDGDGVNDNDLDSDESDPSWTYGNDGIYQVRLVVMDSEGNVDTVDHQIKISNLHGSAEETGDNGDNNNNNSDDNSEANEDYNPVNLNNEDVEKELNLIYATPAMNQDTGIIYLRGTSGRVNLRFNEIDLDINKIFVDGHIFFDSDGDGNRYNDPEFTTDDTQTIYESPIYTPSDPKADPMGISVTVIDTDGNVYFDFTKVVFTATSTTAALKLELADNIGIALYISILLFGLAFGASSLRHRKAHDNKLL